MKATKAVFHVLGLSAALGVALNVSGCRSEGNAENSAENANAPARESTGIPDEVAEEVDVITKSVEADALTRIWHEDCGVPIEKVPTPKGFAISPAEAYYPYRATLARPNDWSQWHLFVDARNYYIVEKRDVLAMLKHSQVIDGTSGKRREYTGELDPASWPAGTVMAADESNATHRMTLTFSIEGHTGDQEYEYLFRVLDKPSNLVISLPASGSHADGQAGGYGLYVMPDPLSVFEGDHVSFKISFSEMRDGKKTSLEETVDVPLLKEDSGQVGLIKYKTEWKAEQVGGDQPATRSGVD